MNFLINHHDKIYAFVILTSSSIYLRFLFEFFGQVWVKTKAHTATIMFLPLIVYVITMVIAGNIALSLGMVGALSIVRFRNPVRSPLELAAYFCAITLGIAAGVSLIWVAYLIISITLGVIILVFIDYILLKFFNRQFFIASFSEGNSLSTLSISTHQDIEILDNSESLISKIKSANIINYTLATHNFSKLKKLEKHPSIQNNILTFELRR